jgi:hypothetical protein
VAGESAQSLHLVGLTTRDAVILRTRFQCVKEEHKRLGLSEPIRPHLVVISGTEVDPGDRRSGTEVGAGDASAGTEVADTIVA